MSLTDGEKFDQVRARRLQESIPASYTIWKDGATYRAECNIAGGTDYSGTDASTVIQATINALTAGRTWKETVLLKGVFDPINTVIKVPSYTRLDLRQASLKLGIDKNICLIENQHCITGCIEVPGYVKGVGDIQVEILGGDLDGNKVNQAALGLCGDRYDNCIFLDCVTESTVKETYTHDAKTNGILVGSDSATVAGYWAHDNWIVRPLSKYNDYCGIAAYSVTNLLVDKPIVRFNTYDGLVILECIRSQIYGGQYNENRSGIVIGKDCEEIDIYGGMAQENSVDGLVADGTLGAIKGLGIYGFRSRLNDTHGMRLIDVTDFNIKAQSWNNSQDPVSTYDALLLHNSLHGIVDSGVYRDDQGAPTQKYGIRETGTSDYNKIMHNTVRGNITAQILKAGANTKVKFNDGYKTENNGGVTVASGDTWSGAAHGLAITPSIQDVVLTPRNTLGNATKFWLGDPDANNIYVHVDVDPGATTAIFTWVIP